MIELEERLDRLDFVAPPPKVLKMNLRGLELDDRKLDDGGKFAVTVDIDREAPGYSAAVEGNIFAPQYEWKMVVFQNDPIAGDDEEFSYSYSIRTGYWERN